MDLGNAERYDKKRDNQIFDALIEVHFTTHVK